MLTGPCIFPWRVGFLIPKGWKVMPLFRNIHHNPDYFQDPQKFDPSRFKVWASIDRSILAAVLLMSMHASLNKLNTVPFDSIKFPLL